jgi:hypothetical protein
MRIDRIPGTLPGCAATAGRPASGSREVLKRIRGWGPRIWVMIAVAAVGAGLIVATVHEGLQPSKYGGVRIPGNGALHLPRGKAIVSFSGFTGGGTANGAAVAVPEDLAIEIYPVDPKVPAAPIAETNGSAESNGDSMTAPIWTVEVRQSAAYHVVAKGSANTGYPDSELVFGVAVDYGHLWLIGAITLGLLLLLGLGPWALRRLRAAAAA